MPIEEAFFNEKEILSPELTTKLVDGFPETVILTFGKIMVDLALQDFPSFCVSTLEAGQTVPVYALRTKNGNIGIYQSPMGGPAASVLMEEILAKGAKRIVAFGACGVLKKGISAGKLIVPTAAIRDEGTSYHYLPSAEEVLITTSKKTAELLSAQKIPLIAGKTWTTDAFYRETPGAVKKRMAQGCLCVEMECASLMAVGAFRKKDVYMFFYAADSLADSSWDARILGKTTDEQKHVFLRVAIQLALDLQNQSSFTE